MLYILGSSTDYRKVYAGGRRYESYLMVAFVLPNGLSHHRFGITASRKAIGNAVERNRAKRLLREAFRSNQQSLGKLKAKYDWVFNARRSLLEVKAGKSIEELQTIIARLASDEISNLLKQE